jgi:hypothetical protein
LRHEFQFVGSLGNQNSIGHEPHLQFHTAVRV